MPAAPAGPGQRARAQPHADRAPAHGHPHAGRDHPGTASRRARAGRGPEASRPRPPPRRGRELAGERRPPGAGGRAPRTHHQRQHRHELDRSPVRARPSRPLRLEARPRADRAQPPPPTTDGTAIATRTAPSRPPARAVRRRAVPAACHEPRRPDRARAPAPAPPPEPPTPDSHSACPATASCQVTSTTTTTTGSIATASTVACPRARAMRATVAGGRDGTTRDCYNRGPCSPRGSRSSRSRSC